MIRRNYCFVCFGVFLFFQRSPGDSSSAVDSSDAVLDDAIIALPFNPVCPAGCATCSTYNGCVTCQTTHFLLLTWHGMRQTGNCVKECPSGYYGTRRRLHGKCLKCGLSNCLECSANSTCTTCANPYLMSKGHCVDRCPKSRPFATKTRTCKKQVDCELSEWSSWEPCSRNGVNCGTKFGRQLRTRLVLQEPSENGQQCQPTVEPRKCKLEPCNCEVVTNESDLSQVETVDGTSKDLASDSPKKSRKSRKPPKKCRQRKNKKQPKKQTTKPDEEMRTATSNPTKKSTKSEGQRRKQATVTSNPLMKTTRTQKMMKTTSAS